MDQTGRAVPIELAGPGTSRRALLLGGLAGGLVLLAGGSAWRRAAHAPQLYRAARPAMGTVAEVLLAHPGPGGPALAEAALEEVGRVEARMTRFDPTSEVGRVNAGPGRFFPVSSMTGHVVRTALEVARATDGAFDPGLGALEALWGFYRHRAPASLPDARRLARQAAGAGYRQVELAGDLLRPRLRVGGAVRLDLGGIAKGYAVDRAAALLRGHGVRHALINVGGDLYALGTHPAGRPWQVGVRHPRRPGRYLTRLSLSDRAVATSGDYENFFIADGQRYHHLLDPRTGAPAPFHQSVTVTARSAMMADALATAAFATPPPQAERLLARMVHGGWLTVDRTGAILRG